MFPRSFRERRSRDRKVTLTLIIYTAVAGRKGKRNNSGRRKRGSIGPNSLYRKLSPNELSKLGVTVTKESPPLAVEDHPPASLADTEPERCMKVQFVKAGMKAIMDWEECNPEARRCCRLQNAAARHLPDRAECEGEIICDRHTFLRVLLRGIQLLLKLFEQPIQSLDNVSNAATRMWPETTKACWFSFCSWAESALGWRNPNRDYPDLVRTQISKLWGNKNVKENQTVQLAFVRYFDHSITSRMPWEDPEGWVRMMERMIVADAVRSVDILQTIYGDRTTESNHKFLTSESKLSPQEVMDFHLFRNMPEAYVQGPETLWRWRTLRDASPRIGKTTGLIDLDDKMRKEMQHRDADSLPLNGLFPPSLKVPVPSDGAALVRQGHGDKVESRIIRLDRDKGLFCAKPGVPQDAVIGYKEAFDAVPQTELGARLLSSWTSEIPSGSNVQFILDSDPKRGGQCAALMSISDQLEPFVQDGETTRDLMFQGARMVPVSVWADLPEGESRSVAWRKEADTREWENLISCGLLVVPAQIIPMEGDEESILLANPVESPNLESDEGSPEETKTVYRHAIQRGVNGSSLSFIRMHPKEYELVTGDIILTKKRVLHTTLAEAIFSLIGETRWNEAVANFNKFSDAPLPEIPREFWDLLFVGDLVDPKGFQISVEASQDKWMNAKTDEKGPERWLHMPVPFSHYYACFWYPSERMKAIEWLKTALSNEDNSQLGEEESAGLVVKGPEGKCKTFQALGTFLHKLVARKNAALTDLQYPPDDIKFKKTFVSRDSPYKLSWNHQQPLVHTNEHLNSKSSNAAGPLRAYALCEMETEDEICQEMIFFQEIAAGKLSRVVEIKPPC